MAKEVDWNERREMVASVVIELIAKSGVEGVTIRDIAKHAGYSTAVTSHYFDNKRELLLFAYQESARRAADEVLDIGKRSSLESALERFLPIDEMLQRNWKVWIAFWDKSISDPDFLAVQKEWNRRALRIVQTLLKESLKDEGIVIRKGLAKEAERLLTSIVGLSVLATLDPKRYTASRLRSSLKEEIRRVRIYHLTEDDKALDTD